MDDLTAARDGDTAAFERLVAGHRRELQAHCYRMLGSLQDAEDGVQESLLAAWRGLGEFDGRSSLRAWLYRITTDACLRLVAQRPMRVRSWDLGPAWADPADLGEPVTEPIWLEPWPQDPAETYARREGVELAFVAALQHLPGTQRAVLILREVLQFPAAEVAEIMDITPASVNSALRRARRVVGERVPAAGPAELDTGEGEVADAFVLAWERADVEGLLALLAEDARFTMPPLPAWFDGRDAIRRFVTERLFATRWRLVPTRLNDQPGFAAYQGGPEGGPFRLRGVGVLSVRGGLVTEIATFIDPALHPKLDLPELPPLR